MARPTLASLAAELGVSRQTISNVINAPDRVKPATLERVRAAIEAAGYRPSAAARQLRTRRSMNLGMRLMPATDGINGSILDRFLHALTESAQDAGYRLTLFCADSHEDEVLQYGREAGPFGKVLRQTARPVSLRRSLSYTPRSPKPGRYLRPFRRHREIPPRRSRRRG